MTMVSNLLFVIDSNITSEIFFVFLAPFIGLAK